MAKLDTVERGVHTLLCYLCYDPVLKYPSFTQLYHSVLCLNRKLLDLNVQCPKRHPRCMLLN